MLSRFVAACLVASVAVAAAALSLLLFFPAIGPERVRPILTIWCVAPCLWGLWAMLAPAAWVPARLPAWGALLGLIAGVLAVYSLDVPALLAGVRLEAVGRAVGVLVAVLFYAALWTLVRAAYRRLTAAPRSA